MVHTRATVTDDLLKWRDEFPALEGCTHLISHSLGCVPRRAGEYLAEFLRLWEEKSITAWDDWLPEVDRAGRRIGRLLGAPDGTVVMNQNVSTVEAVLASCFDYRPGKNKIVYSDLNFPSVSYVWQAERRRGAEIHIVESDGVAVDTARMCEAIDQQTLVVPISHVLFKSAYIQDAKAIAARANEVGAHVILDCYQSLGAIPVDVVDLGVSFATGGSVKWLCGGPGAAYLYVREDLIGEFAPRVTGWFGHESPFAFTMPDQQYADSAWRYMGGTPAVACLYQARAGHEIVAEIGVDRIREKSLRQTGLAIERIDEAGYTLRSPREPERRGNSVVFDFPGAGDVARELNRRRFFCDYRPGAGIRIGPHFYTRDDEIEALFAEIEALRRGRQ
ncbi:MAG: aminotransferase class V-fold PLP-dependent enzyme [Deltaproteobacteria bacterium]|nr:MAG: aminotransferase class V-fold PLP-dependent enzyme [Deltaproteobacteria bacterium]